MKKKKKKTRSQNVARSTQKPCQKGCLPRCGKKLLLTASYQVFSVFLGSAGVQAGLVNQVRDPGLHDGTLSQVDLFSADRDGQQIPGSFLSCVGCTTGPDNVPGQCVANIGGGCSGCTGGTGGGSRRWERYQEQEEQRMQAAELARQAAALYNAGRYREALDLYLRANSLWKKWKGEGLGQSIRDCRSMILVTDANTAIDQEDYERAARLLREAISINPKYAHLWEEKLKECESDAYTKRGVDLIGQGNYKEAEAVLTKAVRTYPKSNWAYNNLGRALLAQQRYREAEVFFRQAIQLNPGNRSAHYNLGLVLQNQERYSEAEAAYRESIRLFPYDRDTYKNLGTVLNRQERYSEAEKAYREMIRLDPNDADAHLRLGASLLNQNRSAEAEEPYRQAIKLDPKDPWGYFNLGEALDRQGRYAEAEEVLRQAQKLAPDAPNVNSNLGWVLKKQEKFTEAEVFYRRAVELNPNHPGTHFLLGTVLIDQGRSAEAETFMRQAIKLAPGESTMYYGLGLALGNQNRYAEAEAAYRKAIELDPNDAVSHERLGDILRFQKRYQEAEGTYRKVLSIEPDNKDVQTSLQTLSVLQQAETAEKHSKESLTRSPDEMSLEARKGFDMGGTGASGPSPVDARGVTPDVVPPRIANHPKYKAFQAEEEGLVRQREALEAELATIRKRKELDVSDKGLYEVEEAHKKQQITNINSEIGVIKVKKRDFIVSFKEEEGEEAKGEKQ